MFRALFCFIFANVCMYYMKTHGLKHVVISTDVIPKLFSTIKVLFFGFFCFFYLADSNENAGHIKTKTQM